MTSNAVWLRAGRLLVAAATGAAAWAAPVAAQLPNASTAAIGLGENYTAAARGYPAITWNPANLSLSGNPQASLAFFPLGGTSGLSPVTPLDLVSSVGGDVPMDVRAGWLGRIRAQGAERGSVAADVTVAAVQWKSFGLQFSTTARGLADIAPDAAELILFGADGLGGVPRSFDLRGSRLRGSWTSTAAFSFARAIPAGSGRLAIGATVKFVVGNAMAYGRDQGSHLDADAMQLNVDFPVVTSDTAHLWGNGHGVGLDVGGAYETEHLTVGVTVQNVRNSFRWDESRLRYSAAEAFFDADSSSAEVVEQQPFSAAPQALRDEVLAQRYEPVISAGLALRAGRGLLLDVDYRRRTRDDGIGDVMPRTHAGVGVEVRPLSWLPLRAGAAYVTGGSELAGGLGLEFGGFALSASAARRAGTTLASITLISSMPR